MRTMTACFGTPEALMINVSVANQIRRRYGIGVWACTTYVDAKTPGLQAAYQKMCALLTAPLGGNRAIGTDGLLSAGQDYSPVQQILENDMQKGVDRFWGHYAVTDDTLATDHILEMLGQTNTNFLTTDHTLMHYAAEQWYPRWMDRSLWSSREQEVAAEQEMLKRIDEYWRDAVRRYEPPQMDQAKIRELDRIYAEAEKKLLS
jgi:trimethylamine:corrinoid methyltransferase-like protein